MLVSVIVTGYNSAAFISECLYSILAQSYHAIELIVVDDNSQDETLSIVSNFIDHNRDRFSKINVIDLDTNIGAGLARNKGLEMASGEYISFCDADDLWHEDKIKRQLEVALSGHYDVVTSNYLSVNSELNKVFRLVKGYKRFSLLSYLSSTRIGFSTSFFHRNVFDSYIFTSDRTRQDLILWIRLLKDGKYNFVNVSELLVMYRVHDAGISSNKVNASLKVLSVYNKYLNYNTLICLFLWNLYAFNAVKNRFFNEVKIDILELRTKFGKNDTIRPLQS